MARQAFKPNVKPAQKIARKDLFFFFGKVLESLGKPFYKTLSLFIVVFLLISQLIGKTIIQSVKTVAKTVKLSSFFTSKYELLNKRLKKKEESHFFRLFILKIKLFFIKITFRFKIISKKISKPKFEIKGLKTTIVFLILSLLIWIIVFKDLPSPTELVTRDQEISTKIYSRDGELLYQIYKDKNRTPVKLEGVPNHIRLATLAAEDAEFYSHLGFSIKGIFRAVLRNIKRDSISGGSTITQQLVKNALLSSEKTVIRKMREVVLAIGVEAVFSKEEILEMYLNEVSYGGTTYGIQEASKIYFGKNANNLNLSEAAFLAGLPKSPTTFSPFGPTPEKGLLRQKDVLNLMLINKFITKEEHFEAVEDGLEFVENKTKIKAPHFVMFVRQKLEEEFGREFLEKGGLQVVTTLDWQIQQMAENVVKEEIEKLKQLNVNNGSVIVLDPKNGEILAMVGSVDYFDTKNDGNVNVSLRLRQPGSSIKPINYAYALSTTFTPATIISDTPIIFNIPGSSPYSPKNYDGIFKGKIPLRDALAQSRNVPAVKVLESYGVEKMFELGKLMGITTWNNVNETGLSLTLGGKEVKLIDMAVVYSVFANGGHKTNAKYLKSITDYKNKEIKLKNINCLNKTGLVETTSAAEATSDICQSQQIVDSRVTFLITNILSDNYARTPAFGQNSLLNIKGYPEVAVKTGTSNNLRDNLAIGYNQDYVTAVWVGNNDNSPMARVASGITGATPIWNKIMTSLLSGRESIPWTPPEGVVQIGTCPKTGTLPCIGCETKLEWFLEETIPTKHCTLDPIDKKKYQGEKILEEAASTIRY